MPKNQNSMEIIFNAESIANAYTNLSQQEAQINDQLEALFSKQCHIEAKFRGITKVIPKLQIVRGDAQKLVDMISHTSALAENVSSKVRQLDVARSRVSECQQRVHDLLDLQLCSQGVQTALHNEDYEKASAHVHRFLSMDQSLLKQTADDVAEDCTNVTNSFSLLQEAANQLRKIVTYKFDEAVKDEDLASVERFFKIFPLIGLKDEGLRKFSIYLTSKLQETSKDNLKLATETQQSDKRASVIYADTLTLLFEGIARILEIHQPLVETYYGPGRLLDVVKILQQECDRQCKRIISEFRRQRQLERIFLQIKEFSRALNNTNRIETKLDPKSVDLLLTELTVMLQRSQLYQRFVRRRVLTDLEAGSQAHKSTELDSALRGLILCMQELLASYLQLEAFYMEASVLKAVSMNTLEENSQTTSMVDDVFFIVNKSIRRAGSTSSLDGACAVLNNACTLLETEFCEVLRQQLRLGFPSGYLDLSQAYNVLHSSLQQGRLQGDSDSARATFLAYMNNAEASLEYTETLKKSLTQELTNALGLTIPCNDQEKLDSCLSGLSTVSSALQSVVNYGMQQLQASAVKPRVHPWLDAYLTSNHQLTEEEFVNYESDKTFIQTVIMNLDGLLKSFKDNLTTGNYDHLVSLVTSEVTLHFEKVIMKSTFNRFGGLVLDKEVRALASYLTSVTSWSVRDKFARLTQIATVLNLEKVQEIVDYWGTNSGSLSWRLSPAEIKKVMALRVDFRNEEIKKLKL